jgi:uncharacterized protein YcgI (DUF1989 family)
MVDLIEIKARKGRAVNHLPPVSKPGDYVILRAEIDAVVAFSARPQDMVPVNGAACVPVEAHFTVI